MEELNLSDLLAVPLRIVKFFGMIPIEFENGLLSIMYNIYRIFVIILNLLFIIPMITAVFYSQNIEVRIISIFNYNRID